MGKQVRLARITSLQVKNYRALKHVELKDITPLTVLLGPNGSGKSTLFDLFAFLSECFSNGLRHAWDRRGRGRELKTRGSDGPIEIEIKFKEGTHFPIVTYLLSVDEVRGAPVVVHERLQWRRGSTGRPFNFLEYEKGEGWAIRGEMPDDKAIRESFPLKSPDLIAVNALGQFAGHPRVAALREFVTGWHISHFSVHDARQQPDSGPQERLSRSGDNLANVIQYLTEQHPDRLENIFEALKSRVPRVEKVMAEAMADGRLLLQIKDAPFDHPVLARFASDGTLKMLAYLILLNDPQPPPFIGIEEPENFLHPRLLAGLAEECRRGAESGQLLVTTHSPFFIDALQPEEVRVLYRDRQGFSHVHRVKDIEHINGFLESGASLGYLWMEGRFGMGDPLVNHGEPVSLGKGKK